MSDTRREKSATVTMAASPRGVSDEHLHGSTGLVVSPMRRLMDLLHLDEVFRRGRCFSVDTDRSAGSEWFRTTETSGHQVSTPRDAESAHDHHIANIR